MSRTTSRRVRVAALLAALASPALSSRASAQSPPAAPTTIAVGDWQLAPSLEVRTKGEWRLDPPDLGGLDFYGRQTTRVRDAWGVYERTRIGLGAEHGALRAQVTLEDAHAAGSPSPTATFTGARGIGQTGAYEAYAEAHGSGARPLYFRLGRQVIVWGEGRLLGAADASPIGRSLDAARAHAAAGNFDFEALGAVLESPGPLGAAFVDTAGPSLSGVELFGVLARYTAAPLLKVEIYGLGRVARSSGIGLDGSRFATARLSGELYTGALRVYGDAKGWDYGAEGVYQLGTADALAVGGLDVSAWAAAAHVAKTIEQASMTPTIRISGSYASGDDGSSGTYKQFDPILADPQRFHGQMDLFGWSNEIDVAGRVSIVPWTDTNFGVEYRYARLAEAQGEWIGSYLTAVGRETPPAIAGATPSPVASPSGANTAKELGHELDVSFAWRPWLPLELRAGWSGLLFGDAAKTIMAAHGRGAGEADGSFKPATTAQYAYGQATLSVP